MAKIIKSETISLKNHPEINENAIQEFIFNDPTVLGLGELIPIQREKCQPLGGRLDILLADPEGMDRYEVEIQLGATDPSHIIRTIEYWDTERKRYPKKNHYAVIVAEDVTGRFLNVISLFNGSIPLIALQMSAIKHGDDVELIFTKVLDIVSQGSEEDEEATEITDRNYWEKRSSLNTMKMVDNLFAEIGVAEDGYMLKYNKFYVGIAKDGVAKNFIHFKPKKNFVHLYIKCQENEEMSKILESSNLEIVYKYNMYDIRLEKFEDFKKNKETIMTLVEEAKNAY